MFQIRIASNSDQQTWNQFIETMPTEQHFFAWHWREIITSVFGHKPYYLILEDERGLQAICPLFLVKSILFGTSLISLPYLNGGGIHSLNPKFIPPIIEYIIKLQEDLNCKYSELRYRTPIEDSDVTKKLSERSHKVAMILELGNDPEKLFESFPPKLRSQIRRPTKEGCTAISVNGQMAQSKHISDFYSVFSDNMKGLGTPVYSKNLFSKSLQKFGAAASLTLIYHSGEPVAGGITVQSGKYVEIPWAASLRSKSQFAPNMLLYWEVLKNSINSGAEIFDFGRSSKDAGTFKFKAQWGAKPMPLYWYYHLNAGELPNVNPNNKKFELFIALWKRLPLALTKIIGPQLTKSLP